MRIQESDEMKVLFVHSRIFLFEMHGKDLPRAILPYIFLSPDRSFGRTVSKSVNQVRTYEVRACHETWVRRGINFRGFFSFPFSIDDRGQEWGYCALIYSPSFGHHSWWGRLLVIPCSTFQFSKIFWWLIQLYSITTSLLILDKIMDIYYHGKLMLISFLSTYP